MKKTLLLTVAVLLIFSLTFTSVALAGKSTSITSKNVYYSSGHYLAGQVIPTGYDAYGYNYQAHEFNGSYANVYLGAAGYPPYKGDDDSYLAANPSVAGFWAWAYRNYNLVMKWNEAWLSNKDQDGDGKLDRHYGYSSYIGSGAWTTNHMTKYFVKIVAVPANATLQNGMWYSASGEEIGYEIWNEFAIVQEIDNSTKTKYISPLGPGFGRFINSGFNYISAKEVKTACFDFFFNS